MRSGGRLAALVLCAGARAELPTFPPTWDMQQSTIAMVCNYSGLLDLSKPVGQYGILDFDWSNAKLVWGNDHPMDAEALLVKQAALHKAANPKAKTWVYRNFVKALPWYASVREKLEDPAYAGFFLKFNAQNTTPYNVPNCDVAYEPPRCSPFYHDQEQTPQWNHHNHTSGELSEGGYWSGSCDAPCDCGKYPCGEYLFDHRNGSMLQEWFLNEYVGGPAGLGDPNIDGFFIDDGWGNGPSEEDGKSVYDMGLSKDDVAAIKAGWQANTDAAKAHILKLGGFNWQMFDHGAPTGIGMHINQQQCTQAMRSDWCRPDSKLQNQSVMYSFAHHGMNATDIEEDLAAFLLVRGPYAWIGYSWVGCVGWPIDGGRVPNPATDPDFQFPSQFKEDYGEPLGTCEETGNGTEVFVRQFSKATVTLDCKNWKGSIAKH